MLFADPITQFT